MNITDIDDKIIKRARQNHLWDKYLEKQPKLEQILDDCKKVLVIFEKKVKKQEDPDKKKMQEGQVETLNKALENVENALNANLPVDESKNELLLASKDLISDWLDDKFGNDVTENSIFSSLPKYWEDQFHKDMEALNILPVDCLTRVSEYIPENVAFIDKVSLKMGQSANLFHYF